MACPALRGKLACRDFHAGLCFGKNMLVSYKSILQNSCNQSVVSISHYEPKNPEEKLHDFFTIAKVITKSYIL